MNGHLKYKALVLVFIKYKGSCQVLRDVWAPRRLGAQEPLQVSCPRVCIELMHQSSGYRTRFDVK